MAKKSDAIDQEPPRMKETPPSREEINAALARLQKIAENLPAVDAVAIVREGRDIGSVPSR